MGRIWKVVKKVHYETSPRAKIKQERKVRRGRDAQADNIQRKNGKSW